MEIFMPCTCSWSWQCPSDKVYDYGLYWKLGNYIDFRQLEEDIHALIFIFGRLQTWRERPPPLHIPVYPSEAAKISLTLRGTWNPLCDLIISQEPGGGTSIPSLPTFCVILVFVTKHPAQQEPDMRAMGLSWRVELKCCCLDSNSKSRNGWCEL